MKALVLLEPGKLEIREQKEPVPKEGEVLIKMRAVGVCSSDVHAYRGSHPFVSYPRVLGHEITGEVVKPSETSASFKVGDLVVVNPVVNCGACYPCRIGRPNCCSNVKTPGIHFDGGMREYMSVPPKHLYKIPGDSDPVIFALTEPLSIALQATNRGRISKKDCVVIIGSGPIGLGCLMVAKALGATVINTDLVWSRLELAKRLGADRVVDVRREDPLKLVNEFGQEVEANVVIEAVGSPETVQQAVKMVSPAGRVVILGLSSKMVQLPIGEIIRKELDIIASRLNNGLFPEAIELIGLKKINMGSLITHVLRLEEAERAIQLLDKQCDGVLKVVLTP